MPKMFQGKPVSTQESDSDIGDLKLVPICEFWWPKFDVAEIFWMMMQIQNLIIIYLIVIVEKTSFTDKPQILIWH